jgi:RNA ligase
MRYQHFDELPDLVAKRIVSRRAHPSLPLDIYNYTASAQHTPLAEWTETMQDCRGLILDRNGDIVGRPFRKFWNYEQVLGQIPNEPFTVWEKLDGSLGIVCSYAGERVCASRGSFESDQAKWLTEWMRRKQSDFIPSNVTFLFEVVYPENRIVVDYGPIAAPFLLAVMADDAVDCWRVFEGCTRFRKAARYDLGDFSTINNDPRYAGQEGFVVQWASGFRAKLKLEEYKRLHRLITQVSTRTIWELLRSGADTAELLERVPVEFGEWVDRTIRGLCNAHFGIIEQAEFAMRCAPSCEPRKDFAMWAKQQPNPALLFALLDGKSIVDAAWRLVEPKWETPFRKDVDG